MLPSEHLNVSPVSVILSRSHSGPLQAKFGPQMQRTLPCSRGPRVTSYAAGKSGEASRRRRASEIHSRHEAVETKDGLPAIEVVMMRWC